MDYEISHLSKLIEEMRKELIQLGNLKPFTDPDVVRLSQRLDLLLNKYQELQYELQCRNTWLEWFEHDDIPHPIPYRIDLTKKEVS